MAPGFCEPPATFGVAVAPQNPSRRLCEPGDTCEVVNGSMWASGDDIQLAVMPASTGRTAPVMAALSAPHNHASRAATSSGSTRRPSW